MYGKHAKVFPWLALIWTGSANASVDSYRYLHVTIETPWVIFLFLLPLVLAPLVLMAVMAWRYAERRKDIEGADTGDALAEGDKE